MVALKLTDDDQAKLDGAAGEGVAMAMRMVVALAGVMQADRLIDIASAHIDGCLYHGQAGLDFAERLVTLGARVAVPTTLNVSSLDLLHPGLVRLAPADAGQAKRLMDAYVALGARSTWTCAPYQEADRPAYGTDIAWAESNAIVFANSALGARTERYGDFIDVCAAITGRVPYAGLHIEERRGPTVAVDCSAIPSPVLDGEAAWAALGHAVGAQVASGIPLLTGIDPRVVDEDRLKAFGAAAASAGGVALFHVESVTPEARQAGRGWARDISSIGISAADLRAARDQLTTTAQPKLDAVSLGTPHLSLTEFAKLAVALTRGELTAGSAEPFHPECAVWISTSRSVLAEARRHGYVQIVERFGGRVVVDTCTYLVPILAESVRTVMTTSGKWAWYAPTNLGVDVVFGTLAECVASARAGRVVRDENAWR